MNTKKKFELFKVLFKSGKSKEQIAKELGISVKTYTRYYNLNYSYPSNLIV